MDLRHAGFLLLLLCSAYCYQFRGRAGYGLFVPDPEQEWERMETVIGEEMAEALAPESKLFRSSSGSGKVPEAKKVIEYVAVSFAEDRKEAFKPEKGARALPDWLKERLSKTAPSTSSANAASSKVVEVLCHVDRMYVRIKREVFKTNTAYKYLKLGKCPVNQGTKDHYYLLYLLTSDCGFSKESKTDYRSVKVPLRYNPTTEVLREMPFDLSVMCKYPRLFHSYKVGFYPKVQGGTIPKKLQPKNGFTLTPQDASGNDITSSKTYTLGQTMYFEAKQPSSSSATPGDQRVYVNKCFMTASADPNSSPRHALIDNYGCMVEGKMSAQSKFLPSSSKMAQKFRVAALIFKEKLSSAPQQLYMHCDVSMGKLDPTPTSKACNYDAATKKWKALFGPDSVCTCCDSSCSSAKAKSFRNMISSQSWKVDMSSGDGYEVQPLMKFSDPRAFRLDDLDMAEHEDFLQNWDHDY